jgi:hypothetical protein
MFRFTLPVSGIELIARPPAGGDDLLLLETGRSGAETAIALLESIASRPDGATLDWLTLPLADVDAAIMRVRQNVLGDSIRSEINCPAAQCGKRIDVAFGIDEFLVHHAPRPARKVEAAHEPGWYDLVDAPVSFRIPTGADLLAVVAEGDTERTLVSRCVRPAAIRGQLLRRVERALEAMAPSLAQDLSARCAECEARVSVHFDARAFALRELRDQAAFIYEETHLLASHYHWPEAEILALPRYRRIQYVEMIRQQGEAS